MPRIALPPSSRGGVSQYIKRLLGRKRFYKVSYLFNHKLKHIRVFVEIYYKIIIDF